MNAAPTQKVPVTEMLASVGGSLTIFGMVALKVWKIRLSTDDTVSENDTKKIKILEGVTGGVDMLLYALFAYALYKQLIISKVPGVRQVFFGLFLVYFMGDKIRTIGEGFGVATAAAEAKEELVVAEEEANTATAEAAEVEAAAMSAEAEAIAAAADAKKKVVALKSKLDDME